MNPAEICMFFCDRRKKVGRCCDRGYDGEALAREIPGARLLVLERAATAIPDALAGEVAAAMLEL